MKGMGSRMFCEFGRRKLVFQDSACPCLATSRPQPKQLACVRVALGLGVLLWAAVATTPLRAQGRLQVTPGGKLTTSAGTGASGLFGDAGAATAAHLAHPSAVAYDSTGDLFVADANNHVVREITPTGTITTVAGSGAAGFGGDGGAATMALLDTPTGIAVDQSGALLIADSHNHRIRRVSQGVITTVVGTGRAGYSGDGGPGTAAQLALPSGVAVDASGNLYIADTNNNRIRKWANGTVSTVAGNGEELFAGDGGAASAASLDQPSGLAVDATGNLYIADRNNQRVRMVSLSGIITTVAGNGAGAFSGAFQGDGAAATGASLAKPAAVFTDAAGNVLIADTNNQRIRQVSSDGTISTVVGSGSQGFGGDGGPAGDAILNTPRGLLKDGAGNLVFADTGNERLRRLAPGELVFGSQAVGTVSAPQTITLSNPGTAPVMVTSVVVSGPFVTVAGASCGAVPITLSPGASCSQNLAFAPAAPGGASGAVLVNGRGVASQTLLLNGGGAQSQTTLVLTASKAVTLAGESVTLTATLSAPGANAGNAGGSVSFYAGSQLLGTSAVSQGTATFGTTALAVGAQTLTATYQGSAGYSTSTSSAVLTSVADLSLALRAAQVPTVEPGHSVAVPLVLTGTNLDGLTGTVVLSTSGLPANLSVAFAPQSVPLGSNQVPVTMTVSASSVGAAVRTASLPLAGAVLLLMLGVQGRRRRSLEVVRRLSPLVLILVFGGGLLMLGALAGCGGSTGFFGQQVQTYHVTVTATATDATGGTLVRSTDVAVTVQ